MRSLIVVMWYALLQTCSYAEFAIALLFGVKLTSHKPLVGFLTPIVVASLKILLSCLIKYAFVFVSIVINPLSQNWPRDSNDCCLRAGNTVAFKAAGGNTSGIWSRFKVAVWDERILVPSGMPTRIPFVVGILLLHGASLRIK